MISLTQNNLATLTLRRPTFVLLITHVLNTLSPLQNLLPAPVRHFLLSYTFLSTKPTNSNLLTTSAAHEAEYLNTFSTPTALHYATRSRTKALR